jgi:hypothetical protein
MQQQDGLDALMANIRQRRLRHQQIEDEMEDPELEMENDAEDDMEDDWIDGDGMNEEEEGGNMAPEGPNPNVHVAIQDLRQGELNRRAPEKRMKRMYDNQLRMSKNKQKVIQTQALRTNYYLPKEISKFIPGWLIGCVFDQNGRLIAGYWLTPAQEANISLIEINRENLNLKALSLKIPQSLVIIITHMLVRRIRPIESNYLPLRGLLPMEWMFVTMWTLNRIFNTEGYASPNAIRDLMRLCFGSITQHNIETYTMKLVERHLELKNQFMNDPNNMHVRPMNALQINELIGIGEDRFDINQQPEFQVPVFVLQEIVVFQGVWFESVKTVVQLKRELFELHISFLKQIFYQKYTIKDFCNKVELFRVDVADEMLNGGMEYTRDDDLGTFMAMDISEREHTILDPVSPFRILVTNIMSMESPRLSVMQQINNILSVDERMNRSIRLHPPILRQLNEVFNTEVARCSIPSTIQMCNHDYDARMVYGQNIANNFGGAMRAAIAHIDALQPGRELEFLPANAFQEPIFQHARFGDVNHYQNILQLIVPRVIPPDQQQIHNIIPDAIPINHPNQLREQYEMDVIQIGRIIAVSEERIRVLNQRRVAQLSTINRVNQCLSHPRMARLKALCSFYTMDNDDHVLTTLPYIRVTRILQAELRQLALFCNRIALILGRCVNVTLHSCGVIFFRLQSFLLTIFDEDIISSLLLYLLYAIRRQPFQLLRTICESPALAYMDHDNIAIIATTIQPLSTELSNLIRHLMGVLVQYNGNRFLAQFNAIMANSLPVDDVFQMTLVNIQAWLISNNLPIEDNANEELIRDFREQNVNLIRYLDTARPLIIEDLENIHMMCFLLGKFRDQENPPLPNAVDRAHIANIIIHHMNRDTFQINPFGNNAIFIMGFEPLLFYELYGSTTAFPPILPFPNAPDINILLRNNAEAAQIGMPPVNNLGNPQQIPPANNQQNIPENNQENRLAENDQINHGAIDVDENNFEDVEEDDEL